jgi:hypothetical protein
MSMTSRWNSAVFRVAPSSIFFLIVDRSMGLHTYTPQNADFFCNPISFAICTGTFSKLCKNVYNGLQNSTPL